jgi:hypothetical protein
VDWNSEIHRSNFVLGLLQIGELDVDQMMDTLYDVLSEKHVEIFSGNDRPTEEIESALNQIIKWFEDNERYEECHKLKQIKEQCLELR